jgi:hypothetical protein
MASPFQNSESLPKYADINDRQEGGCKSFENNGPVNGLKTSVPSIGYHYKRRATVKSSSCFQQRRVLDLGLQVRVLPGLSPASSRLDGVRLQQILRSTVALIVLMHRSAIVHR